VAAVIGLLLTAGTSHADIFTGTLFYTNFQGGGDNVNKVSFNYDDSNHALAYGGPVGVAAENGADGIMFAPNGNIIVTSNATNNVYRIDSGTGALLQTVHGSSTDFHMALDPSGTKFYSSDRYNQFSGPLDTFTINPNGTFTNASSNPITGNDPNVTQLAFAPNGKILYTDGSPNRNGTVGLFDLATDKTTQLLPELQASHGVQYDPFTGLWTMFGGGAVATMDPNAGTNAQIAASVKQLVTSVPDFDQGSVDGFGHALIAGSNGITFIDYRKSGDITNPDRIIFTSGFNNIDDVAPLVGLGSNPFAVPEPSSLSLLAFGAFSLLSYARFRRAKK
jgi:WD40 repeat protein